MSIVTWEYGWDEQIKTTALNFLEDILEDGFKTAMIFTPAAYAKVYSICYAMCIQPAPNNWSQRLYDSHGETVETYFTDKVLPSINSLQGNELMLAGAARNEQRKIMIQWHQKFFMYLDRYHAKYNNLLSIEAVITSKFKRILFEPIKADLAKTIIEFVCDDSLSEVAHPSIRSNVEMFEEMGAGSPMNEYNTVIETPLLAFISELYERNSTQWWAQANVPFYLERVDATVKSLKTTTLTYLPAQTEPKISALLNATLLGATRRAEIIAMEGTGCIALLAQDRITEMAQMVRLFSRVTGGLDAISDIFTEYIKQYVRNNVLTPRTDRIKACNAEPAAGAEKAEKAEKESGDDPVFIRDMLAAHDKFTDMVSTQFFGEPILTKSIQDAFSLLVNTEIGKFKPSELIATFFDRLLKTGGEKIDEAETETLILKMCKLFTYLTEQDLFADVYRTQLATRLLTHRSASMEMEKMAISGFKSRCGAQFTSKMEGMLHDLILGATQSALFATHVAANQAAVCNIDFGVQTLTTGHWPTYRSFDTLVLPSHMQQCIQTYKSYYDNTVGNRRLAWAFTLGDASIKATFGKKTFDLQVSTLQAIVLCVFNKDVASPGGLTGAPIPFAAILAAVGVPEETLKRILHSLSCGKHKVLLRIAAGEKSGDKGSTKGILPTDTFSFNDKFTCPMRKIRIPMPSLEESGHNTKRVDEDRTIAIEAAIVRIMKARQMLNHQTLVAEVLTQLAFFRPDPKLIKRRIEALIDREYLERDPDNQGTYKYLA